MSAYSLHFARVTDLISLERRLIRALVRDPSLLSRQYEALYRYALSLAQIGWLRTPSGEDVFLAEALTPYRNWLRDQLLELLPESQQPDGSRLHHLGPLIAIRTDAVRQALLTRYVDQFDADTLDRELRQKRFALVLGGGGGSGLAHLGMFSLLDDLGIVPEYIAGSSMGALLGLLRALRKDYDPVATLLALPRKFDLREVFTPFTGRTRFGFPGAFHMDLVPMASRTIQSILGRPLPRFSELPIPLDVVATGVRSGVDVDEERLEKELSKVGSNGFSPWKLRSKVRIFFRVVRQLASNPRFLKQVVFNEEEGTQDLRVIDAVGFSCSVPGLLHFDIFDHEEGISSALQSIFNRHGLFRLTDGGVINNVPSRVAWESVQKGKLGHRNAFVYALDPFAPVPNRNAMFIPIQRLARAGVLANRPYSHYTRTLRTVPNPINLAPSFKHLQRLVHHVRAELTQDAPFIQRMLTTLPPYQQWSPQLDFPQLAYAEAS